IERRKRNVPWWNNSLTQLRSTARRWKRKAARCKDRRLREAYSHIWKQHQECYERSMMEAKKKGWRENLSNQNKETIWKKVFRLCKDVKVLAPSTITRDDGTSTSGAKETATYLLDQFLPDDDFENDNDHHKIVRQLAKCNCDDD